MNRTTAMQFLYKEFRPRAQGQSIQSMTKNQQKWEMAKEILQLIDELEAKLSESCEKEKKAWTQVESLEKILETFVNCV